MKRAERERLANLARLEELGVATVEQKAALEAYREQLAARALARARSAEKDEGEGE